LQSLFALVPEIPNSSSLLLPDIEVKPTPLPEPVQQPLQR
jgi:hypothetical protein